MASRGCAPTLPPVTEGEARTFLMQWWDGVWHGGDIGLIDELMADTYVQHSTRGNAVLDRQKFKELMVQYQRVLHGPVTTIDDFTVDGDKLWLRATSKGVNLETNAVSIVTWLLVYRFEEGHLAEGWVATIPDVDWNA